MNPICFFGMDREATLRNKFSYLVRNNKGAGSDWDGCRQSGTAYQKTN
ncbi:MAG: hypothetical protein IPL83_19370 [Bdellovibrionales bacterium]|nr:hypothetical protein [Bdellovibrionales bacterium]